MWLCTRVHGVMLLRPILWPCREPGSVSAHHVADVGMVGAVEHVDDAGQRQRHARELHIAGHPSQTVDPEPQRLLELQAVESSNLWVLFQGERATHLQAKHGAGQGAVQDVVPLRFAVRKQAPRSHLHLQHKALGHVAAFAGSSGGFTLALDQ